MGELLGRSSWRALKGLLSNDCSPLQKWSEMRLSWGKTRVHDTDTHTHDRIRQHSTDSRYSVTGVYNAGGHTEAAGALPGTTRMVAHRTVLPYGHPTHALTLVTIRGFSDSVYWLGRRRDERQWCKQMGGKESRRSQVGGQAERCLLVELCVCVRVYFMWVIE